MSEQPSVTTREAVLASLLAHACFIIYVLLFPDAFKWSGRSLFDTGSSDQPVKVEFLTQPRQQTKPPSALMGDAGKQIRSEQRPADAPPPRNEDPYSQGNTRNRFVAPPMPEKTRPSPQPGQAGSDRSETSDMLASRQPEQNQSDAEKSPPGDPPDSAFYVPRKDGGSGRPESTGSSLKEALDRMSTGMSVGGAPLKFNNPTGGLTGPLGGLSFDTPGFDWGPYARKIYWVIWTNWTRGWPPAAWAGIKGVVTVHFTINRDGRITGITVLDPSGTPAFDTCATVALEASSPLPALPSDFPDPSEGITARFLYNTDSDSDQ